jgi:hypothetical protein
MEFTGFGKAYVPCQELCELYPAKEGLIRGTIFPELDIPYVSPFNPLVNSAGAEEVEEIA